MQRGRVDAAPGVGTAQFIKILLALFLKKARIKPGIHDILSRNCISRQEIARFVPDGRAGEIKKEQRQG